MTSEISIEINKIPQSYLPSVDLKNVPFGKVYSDHMLEIDFIDGKWQTPVISPHQKISISPATSVLHYGQSIFEGTKAYKDKNGKVYLFRPNKNAARFNKSAVRMCMPQLPEELFLSGLKALINIDRGWVPSHAGGSLYIRPFMIATDEYVGIRPSDNYKFIVIACPVNSYYTKPVNVKIEQNYSRAAEGGVGDAKAAGNYAASLYPAKLAQEQGYDQLIWTDAKEHKYIEESGTMNIMFLIDNVLYTPELSRTILAGITRDSVLTIARDWGVEVKETKLSLEFIIDSLKKGKVQDAFGVGTAATIAQINKVGYEDTDFHLPPVELRSFSNKMKQYLSDYKTGIAEDKYGWRVEI